jgi:3-oxoacyl-[acyl-carrier-protein] synthase III
MLQRRISHAPVSELPHVAAQRALAAAGKSSEDVDLIVFCTTTPIVYTLILPRNCKNYCLSATRSVYGQNSKNNMS